MVPHSESNVEGNRPVVPYAGPGRVGDHTVVPYSGWYAVRNHGLVPHGARAGRGIGRVKEGAEWRFLFAGVEKRGRGPPEGPQIKLGGGVADGKGSRDARRRELVMPDFLPRGDSQLSRWGLAFARGIAAEPGAFGVSVDDAAECVAAADAFAAKQLITANPGMRNGTEVILKNQRRAELKRIIRSLVKRMRANAAVSDAQLSVVNLKPRRTDYSKRGRPLPEKGPVVDVLLVKNATFTLHARTPDALPRSGLPRNATRVTLMAYAGEAPPSNPREWSLVGNSTRARMRFSFGNALGSGTKVWFCAYFTNGRGDVGPVGPPRSARVQDIDLMVGGERGVRMIRRTWAEAA